MRGNVIDLAVAVIIGAAFNRIVTSLVNDIIMPFFGIILGGLSFEELTYTYNEAVIAYGLFIQSIVDFLVIAFSVFIFIHTLNKMKKKEEPPKPGPSQEVILLTEIRDALKERV